MTAPLQKPAPAGSFPAQKPSRFADRPLPDHAPTKDELQRWVDADRSDRWIASVIKRRSGKGVNERWVRDLRTSFGIRRLLLTGARSKEKTCVVRDQLFKDSSEADAVFERVRHGEWSIEDIEDYTGCSTYDCRYEYETWLKKNRRSPLQSSSQRAALAAIADPDATMIERASKILGRRMRILDSGSAIVDGERMTVWQAIDVADDEAIDLGLPSIVPHSPAVAEFMEHVLPRENETAYAIEVEAGRVNREVQTMSLADVVAALREMGRKVDIQGPRFFRLDGHGATASDLLEALRKAIGGTAADRIVLILG